MKKVWTILHKESGEIANKKAVRELFDQLKDGKYLIEITDKNKRSNPQNAYYWAAVIPLVQQGIKDLGTEVTKEETHEFLKSKFNFLEIVNTETAQCERIPRSTTALSKSEFSEYVAKIQQFAAEFLNTVIPDPGQVLELYQ